MTTRSPPAVLNRTMSASCELESLRARTSQPAADVTMEPAGPAAAPATEKDESVAKTATSENPTDTNKDKGETPRTHKRSRLQLSPGETESELQVAEVFSEDNVTTLIRVHAAVEDIKKVN